MLKGYVKGDAEEARRNNADTFLTIDNRNRFADSEKFTALMVAALTRLFDDRSKRGRTAVHNRYFGPIDIYVQIVYAVGGQR